LGAALAGLGQLVDPFLDVAARQAREVLGAERRADVEADRAVVVVVKNMTSSGTRILNSAFMAPPIFSHPPRRCSIDGLHQARHQT
jgi:hypothetical protein